MLSYQHLLEIGLSPDAETLQARLVDAAAELGFGLSGGTHIIGRMGSGRETVHALFGNTPSGFLDASRSVDVGLQDPFLAAMLAKPGCHVYDEAFYRDAGADGLWDLISAYGYRHGMAISVHEQGHLFTFGVDGPDGLPEAPDQRLQLQADLMLLTMHAHEAARRLWTPRPAVDLNAVTAPERAALQWAREGVSVWAAGGKLVYSNPGLAGLQRSVERKLGAGPRAVLRAIEGGLID